MAVVGGGAGFGGVLSTALTVAVYTLVVYTGTVLDQIEGFDWDAANVGHILRHAVTPVEVEEAVDRS